MAGTIVPSTPLTFYRNQGFDIGFALTPPTDASFTLTGSSTNVINAISGERFTSSTGFSSLGSQGTLTVQASSNGIPLASSNYPITSLSRIDPSWTSIGGTITLYKYEPFGNTISTVFPGDILSYPDSATELLGYLTGTGTSTVQFRGSNGATTVYPNPLSLVVQCSSSGVVVDSVSTQVSIRAARLTLSPCNASLNFYRNEPISPTTFSLVSAALGTGRYYSATTLPTGLSLVQSSGRSFDLTGIPTLQTLNSNYSIFAQDTSGRTYSTQVSIVVNPERLVLTTEGSTTQTDLLSNVAITPIRFTTRVPPYTGFRSVRYSWSPQPPQGLQFQTTAGPVSGSSVTIGEGGVDASFALTLSGAITAAQIEAFALSGSNNPYTMTLSCVRSSGGTALSPASPVTLSFGFRDILLSSSNLPTLYVGADVSGAWISATSYFLTTDASITDIRRTDGILPDGVDGSFNPIRQRFELTGRPTAAATYTFTLAATNGIRTLSIPVAVPIRTDSIVLTPSTDVCYTFLQYRNLSNPVSGFYPSPIGYTASAASGCNVVVEGSNLPTGVEVLKVGTRWDLSGFPITAVPALTTAKLTARVLATGAVADVSFRYTVAAEDISFAPGATFALTQNTEMTPVRLTANAKSGQPILGYSSPSLPANLQIANTGLVSGTLLGSTAGSFDVTAYTAYSTGTKTFSYSVSADKVLLVPSVTTTTVQEGDSVSIPIFGYSASGRTVSNYQFTTPSYGLSIGSTTGLLSGIVSNAPADASFTLLGQVGLVDGSLSATMTTTNLTLNRANLLMNQGSSNLKIYTSSNNGDTWASAYSGTNIVASRIGTNGSNTFLVPTSSDTLLRSTTGVSYSAVALGISSRVPYMTAAVNKPGTSTWWIAGSMSNGASRQVALMTSADDGLTWSAPSFITTNGFTDRGSNGPYANSYDAYLNGGVELAYRNGVLLLGGNQILRSLDDGATWSSSPSSLVEVSQFSLDQGTVWIAAGSSRYRTMSNSAYSTAATSFVVSTDQGESWSDAPTGFALNAYTLAYANGAWVASGLGIVDGRLADHTRYSFDGLSWTYASSIPPVSLSPVISIAWGGGATPTAISSDGITWSSLPVSPFSRGRAAAWNGSLWVAVGEGTHTIATSPDGTVWTGQGKTIFTNYGTAIAWNGSLWVALGTGTNTIATSPDGSNWTGLGTGVFSTIGYGIAWNGSRWVAVGQGTNTLATSTNGTSWTGLGTSIFSSTGRSVVWAGTQWVAVGSGTNTVATSTNGTSWTGRGSPAFTTTGIAVAWNGFRLIGGGLGTTPLAFSSNGITWTAAGTHSFTQVEGLAWNGDRWIALGNSTSYRIATSTNGSQWTGQGNPVSVGEGSIALWTPTPETPLRTYLRPNIVAVGDGRNAIAYSVDGSGWTGLGTTVFSSYGRGVAWNGSNLWVAVGAGTNTIASSPDGVVWTGRGNTVITSIGFGVAYGSNSWLALGEGTNTLARSTDGSSWTGLGAASPFSTRGNGAAWNGSRWVAVGEGTNTLATSTDGSSWTGLGTSVFSSAGYGVAWNGSLWVAVGSGGNSIAWSSNGTTWTGLGTSIFSMFGISVAWNGSNLWVAGGRGTNVFATSPDGSNWTGRGTGGGAMTTGAWGVSWTGNQWVAVGLGTNSIATSSNGISWTGRTGTGVFSTMGLSVASRTIANDVERKAPGYLSPVALDETEWKVLRTYDTGTTLYSHPYDTPLDSGWTSLDISSQLVPITNSTRFPFYAAQLVDPGTNRTTITFSTPPTGPIFTSPTYTELGVWQFMPLPDIVFTAPGASFYFISPLPVGLSWNPATRTVSGACMRTGTQSFTVYASSPTGTTAFPLTLVVAIPRVIKKQSSASAYTALVRDYTEVNAAQSGRDARAFPTQTEGIGQLAAPYPPAVTTPSNCPC